MQTHTPTILEPYPAMDSASPDISPSTRALQDIVAMISKSGLSTIRLDSSVSSASDGHFTLSPPLPIDNLLNSIGLEPVLASKISISYNHAALRLKEASECRWKQTLQAYKHINRHFGVSSFNYELLRVAAVNIYARALQKMASGILSSYEGHLLARHPSFSPTVSRTLSVAYAHLTLEKLLGYVKQRTASKAQRKTVEGVKRAVSHSFPCTNNEKISFVTGSTSCRRKSAAGNRAWNHANTTTSDNPLKEEGAACAFPLRYTHRQVSSSRCLPSSTDDFFPQARFASVPKSPSEALDMAPDNVVEIFGGLCIRDITSKTKAGGTTMLRPPPFFVSDVHQREADESPRFFDVHLHTPPNHLTHTPSRRTVAPIPKTARAYSMPDTGLTPKTRPIPVRASIAAVNMHGSSLHTPTDQSVHSPPPEQMRRRKVVALPRRRPAIDINQSHSRSPDMFLSSNRPSNASPIPCSYRQFSSASRTPSLVSTSSSRSNSPSPSDAGLQTPPSSPSVWTLESSPTLFHSRSALSSSSNDALSLASEPVHGDRSHTEGVPPTVQWSNHDFSGYGETVRSVKVAS